MAMEKCANQQYVKVNLLIAHTCLLFNSQFQYFIRSLRPSKLLDRMLNLYYFGNQFEGTIQNHGHIVPGFSHSVKIEMRFSCAH